ncbi:GGDEF domain-containing protein [Alteromonas sp. PRIM-21]|uniref:GGDEF domain-containing protein n=1 Tax=Alteromonas sp. PRIM-21 TaxID=1454978 RepID=UPI0022B97414|nr:GGDEF domain-containing protein [Alteromonas sp. PRIM-21]MCZ8530932.1 diguanylate cyclase [Alteromonas sp. PRIM-21]
MQIHRPSEQRRLRIALIIGAVLVLVFMAADIVLLPSSMYELYTFDRLLLQFPIILIVVVLSFWREFMRYRAYIFAGLLIALSYSNYWLIWVCWEEHNFIFPYEGTILYAFFCVFALGIPFKLAASANVINILGFLGLMWLAPVYGDRVPISAAFVSGSLFICVYARYRLDRSVRMLKETNDRLLKLSKFDPLSDLLNRRALRDQSEKLLALSKRHDVSMAVLMLDLDDFKKYNDSFGHQQGDEAIKEQARIMKQVFKRETDILGRYGGEEFIVVLSDISKEQVEKHAQTLLDKWERAQLKHAEGAKHPFMSCSIGVAYASTVGEISIDWLIDEADKVLYEAKEKGKAQYVVTEAQC